LDEATLIPRYLHFLIAAIAIAGLFIALKGLFKLKSDNRYARYQIGLGAKSFTYATMIQFVTGIWFFMALPGAQRKIFMGGNYAATAILLLALIGIAGAIFIIFGAGRRNNPKTSLLAATSIAVLVTGLMVIARDILRDSYLSPYLQPSPSQTQWEVFPLFLLIFLAGVFVWIVMMKRYRFLREKPAEATVMASSRNV
jgi:hypothetical protein